MTGVGTRGGPETRVSDAAVYIHSFFFLALGYSAARNYNSELQQCHHF